MLAGSGNRLAAPPSSRPRHPPSCPQLYCLDAGAVAEEVGLGRRVNMVMQSAFFALSGVMSMEKVRAAGCSCVAVLPQRVLFKSNGLAAGCCCCHAAY